MIIRLEIFNIMDLVIGFSEKRNLPTRDCHSNADTGVWLKRLWRCRSMTSAVSLSPLSPGGIPSQLLERLRSLRKISIHLCASFDKTHSSKIDAALCCFSLLSHKQTENCGITLCLYNLEKPKIYCTILSNISDYRTTTIARCTNSSRN
jgi:hypothetical protein